VARVGTRYMVKRAGLEVVRRVLKRVGIRISQQVLGKSITRFIPLIGAAAVAGYAYYDTTKVGGTAAELFSREIDRE